VHGLGKSHFSLRQDRKRQDRLCRKAGKRAQRRQNQPGRAHEADQSGSLDFFQVKDEDIDHFFEAPIGDEIDVLVGLDWK
jgi:hypothetical protein